MMPVRDRVAAALPEYEVGPELGRGGSGVVLQGRHLRLGREVAIKFLRVQDSDPNSRSHFVTEAQLLASLDHPHIVPVYDFVDHDGLYLLVMERLCGGDVGTFAQQPERGLESICALALAACSALEYAHRRGVLHRDIKPDNLLLGDGLNLKVADFGIAKLLARSSGATTQPGELVGTPLYMAPEQLQGRGMGPPTDVYALGMVLYELLAGAHPFAGQTDPLELAYLHVHEPPALLTEVPPPLVSAIMAALAKDPQDRYASAAEFASAVSGAAAAALGDGWLARSGVRLFGGSGPAVAGEAGSKPRSVGSDGGAVALPLGTITFVFTDVAGSTRLWEEHAEAAGPAMARHDVLVEGAVAAHGGTVVRPRGEGDSRFAVFARPSGAVAAALAVQRSLQAEDWQAVPAIRVRIAVHTGDADVRHGDYYGSAVNRCARLRSLGHPGQILVSGSTADLVRDALPAGCTLRDFGYHRLKDLATPERVFQLDHPDLSEHDFAPLRGEAVAKHNLPPPVTSFVGREHAVETTIEALESARLVTLTGPGGVGKTRLSIEVARALVERFSEGVWLVPLAPVTEGRLIPAVVASALGIPTEDERAGTVEELLAGRRTLLVLDNCEHQVEGVAQLCESLLRTCPGVRVLATSREALRLPGEHLRAVPPLALPERGAPAPPGSAETAAVRLFDDRAKAVLPSFSLTDANVLDVAEVCRRLDGIPLAIELAAVRVPVLSPRQINERLADRFRLLTGGGRTTSQRQRTLRAAMDWSYDLLSDDEKGALQGLSVFRGSFDLEAAVAVVGGEDLDDLGVLDIVTGLVEKSLVVAGHGGPGERVRYRLLETIREYSAEKLEAAGGAEQLRVRHRQWFLRLAAWAADEVREGSTRDLLAPLEEDQDNFRAAMEWSRANGDVESALRLASALWLFWDLGGHFADQEATLHLDRAIEPNDSSDASGDVRPETLLELAEIQELAGCFDRAWSLAERAMGVGAGDAALGRMAAVRRKQGCLDQAMALLDSAQGGDTDPGLLLERGQALLGTGRFEESIVVFERALRLVDPMTVTEGHLLLQLARAEASVDRLNAALAHVRRARDVLLAHGDTRGVISALRVLGGAYEDAGRLDDAAQALRRALELAESVQHVEEIGGCLLNLGLVQLSMGELGEAITSDRRAMTEFERVGHLPGTATACANLAEKLCAVGVVDEALEHCRRALDIGHDLDDRLTVADATFTLASIRLAQGLPEEAATAAREAARIFEEVGAQPFVKRALALAERAREGAGP